MNDTSPRCAASGTTCRLLQLETPGSRPVWAVLDAAGARRFTGEITLASRPQVRAWFIDGTVYYAERAGDPSIGERLIEYGVVTPEELAAGTVQLGAIAHLGRLFDRVPTIERDPVELVLEVVTGEVLGAIADHTVDEISIASYRHHPSGVAKWRRTPVIPGEGAAPITGEVPVIDPVSEQAIIQPVDLEPVDLEPTAEDHELVAEYEQLMAAPIGLPLAVGEPTQQLVVDDALRILESPTVLPAPALHVPAPPAVVETPVDETVDEEPVDEQPDEQRPFSFEFDLDKVLAQVALENEGLPVAPLGGETGFDDDIRDDVRAAVQAALAEIEAATRPVVTDGLSATAFAVALDSAPDSPADIEPAVEQVAPVAAEPTPPLAIPRLPGRDEAPNNEAVEPTSGESTGAAAGTGLRRLIGGSRKP